MHAYFLFQLKKIVKQNLKPIIFCILLIALFIFLDLDLNILKNCSFIENQNNSVVTARSVVVLDSEHPEGKEGELLIDKKKPHKDKQFSKRKDLIANENSVRQWSKVPKSKKHHSNKLEISYQTPAKRSWLNRANKFLKALHESKIPKRKDNALAGIQLFLALNNKYWLTLFLLLIIFILAKFYTSSYQNGEDLTQILPVGRMGKIISNLGVGLLVICSTYLIIAFSFFASSILFFGQASLRYPLIVHQTWGYKATVATAPAVKLVPTTVALQLLNILTLVIFINLVAKVCHKLLTTILVSSATIASLVLATMFLTPFHQIAQWLPTTYLSSLRINTGSISYYMNNFSINFEHGVLTLVISSLLMLGLTLIVDYRSESRIRQANISN